MAEAHEAERVLLVLRAGNELGDAVGRADLLEHFKAGLVRAPVGGPPETGNAGGDAGKGICAGGRCKPDGGGRRILFVVRMEREDAIHGAGHDRVHMVFLGRNRKAHVKEVGRIIEVISRINEGLADGVFVGPSRDRRHFRDQPVACDFPLTFVGDVGRIVVERRHCTHDADHDRHGMGVPAEPAEEILHLLVQHGMPGDREFERLQFFRLGQVAVKQKKTDFEVMRFLGQLVDRVAAVQEFALVAIDIGNG